MAIAKACSTAAFTCLVFEFVLSARPKFAERYFSMDRFYGLHSFMDVVAVILAFVHRTVLEEMGEGLTGRLGDIAWFGFLAIVLLGLLFLQGPWHQVGAHSLRKVLNADSILQAPHMAMGYRARQRAGVESTFWVLSGSCRATDWLGTYRGIIPPS